MKEVKSHLWLIVAVVATGEPNNRPVRQQTAIDCPKDATDVDGDVHVTDADGPKVVWGLCICDGDDRGLNGDPAQSGGVLQSSVQDKWKPKEHKKRKICKIPE